jgi:hypothetical protein
MRIKFLATGLAAALWLAAALPATAQEAKPYHGLSEQDRQEVRERWDQMSEEERARVRRQADEYWAGLSEEEREAKRQELRSTMGSGRAPMATAPAPWAAVARPWRRRRQGLRQEPGRGRPEGQNQGQVQGQEGLARSERRPVA